MFSGLKRLHREEMLKTETQTSHFITLSGGPGGGGGGEELSLATDTTSEISKAGELQTT